MTVIYGTPSTSRQGYTDTYSGNYYLDVARGNVEGSTAIHKFGLAEDVDVADGIVSIWDGTADDLDIPKTTPYNYSDVADISEVVSTNATDNTTVRIEGLDYLGRSLVQDVQLQGTTVVSLEAMLRVNRMYNVGATELLGDVYLSTDGQNHIDGVPQIPNLVRSIIHNENQQTQQAIFSVPYNKVLYITHGWTSISKATASEAVVTIWKRSPGSIFRKIHTLALQTTGSSSDHRLYEVPIVMEPGTDLEYRAEVFSNSTAVSAGFHGILVDDPSISIVDPVPVQRELVDSNADQIVDSNGNPLVTIGIV